MKPSRKNKKLTLALIALLCIFGVLALARTYDAAYVGGAITAPLGLAKKLQSRAMKQEMLTTAYSKADSCHYPTKNGKCLTASGTIARPGVAACPPDWPFGKKFSLDGIEYTCQDRYATYLSPRLDIWVEEGALEWGAQKKVVSIVE